MNQTLPAGCRWIDLPTATDPRGSLTFLEVERHAPFRVERVFWIYDIPPEASRGGHAHRTCAELLFPLAGGCSVLVDDGRSRATVLLHRPQQGLLIPADVWCELTDFLPQTVCLCLASQSYAPTGYVHDYEQFLAEKRCR